MKSPSKYDNAVFKKSQTQKGKNFDNHDSLEAGANQYANQSSRAKIPPQQISSSSNSFNK